MKRLRRLLAILMLIVLASTGAVAAAGYDEHEVSFDRIMNARDLGGYRTEDGRIVKSNMLLRTAELAYATNADLARLKTEYDLGQVIDFRYSTDFRYCPDKRIAGVEYVNISAKSNSSPSKKAPKNRYRKLKKKSDSKLRKAAIPMFSKVGRSYTNSLVNSSYSQRMYKQYFDRLLANDSGRGVLIHCVYGKDRTGVGAFMTLIALGVDEETAYQDYAMTNSCLKKYGEKTYRKGRIGVREKDLRYAVNKAKKRYGSLDKFLKAAYGLDAAKIEKLRSIYTEEPQRQNVTLASAL